MNSKRSRSKIYKLIDIFFISAPIILILVSYLWYISCSKGANPFVQFGTESNYFGWFPFEDIGNGDAGFVFVPIYAVDNYIQYFFNFANHNSLSYQLFNIFNNLFVFLGLHGTDTFDNNNLISFMQSYLTYIIIYEFISLLINVIMWLPRYLRNWVQEKTDTMI